jgi:hypothetical protein
MLEMAASAGVIAADLNYLRLALPHVLALGVAGRRPAPFGMVDVIERLGLSAMNPERLAADDLIDLLMDDIPASAKTRLATERALLASGTWTRTLLFVASWFEEDADVLEPAAGLKLSRPLRLDRLLNHVLPARRYRWAEVIGWTTLALRAASAPSPIWMDLTLVAREICGRKPLNEIPIMALVANATVEAWGARL